MRRSSMRSSSVSLPRNCWTIGAIWRTSWLITPPAARGPIAYASDLRKRGLRTPDAESALDAYPDWMAHLKRARQKKFGTSLPTNYADRQRQARFLAYRGFTGAQIRGALGFDTDLDAADTIEDI